ncbi:MAG: tetratricopeptide repeat protein [Phycisphaeraceae bacterium]
MNAKPSNDQPICGDAFLAALLPPLKACDAAALAQAALRRWHPAQICDLLRHPHVDVRRVAAVTMGMVGNTSHVACLSVALNDTDKQVSQLAEHSLWSIWFRSGNSQAVQPFREGLALLAADNYPQAITQLKQAVAIDPQFAEAFNQLGIAFYLNNQFDESIKACRCAVRLVPHHFGAISGMGHCFAQLGELQLALRCYRRARRINPRMDGISDAIDRLQTKIKDMSDSGEFLVDSIMA